MLSTYSTYKLDNPAAIAYDGQNLWVTNTFGNSVTEIDASTGALVQVLSGGNYGFNLPGAVAVDGSHTWVANGSPDGGGASLTEIIP